LTELLCRDCGSQVGPVQHRLVVIVRQTFRDAGQHCLRTRDQRRNAGAPYLGPRFHALHEQRHPLLVCDLTQMAYQKWVSLFMQGMESWTEVRRTGVPALVPGCRAVMRHIPERLPYDDNESVLNGTNMTAAVTRQGFAASNDIAKPLWFTKRTTSTTYPPPVPCP